MKRFKSAVRPAKPLFRSVRALILQSKFRVARSVNQELTLLYWSIGKLLKTAVLGNVRAGYGEQVIENLSRRLTAEFGKGWSKQQLWNCLYTVETFPSKKIVSTLSGELSWSHIKELVYVRVC